ncbi:MAG: hypothetical protein ACYDHT_02360 [Solirubrobacteraceae bacterium]
MRGSQTNVIDRLAEEDPARGMSPEETSRTAVWNIVRSSIEANDTQSSRPRERRRLPMGRFAAVGLTVMVASVGVAFASGLLRVGTPAKLVEQFEIPTSGFGGVTSGSPKLLAISTPDPDGGAPWGLRTFTTTRGAGCVQAGRVVDGQIGVLGTDGAFGNDGRLHPIPVASTSALACSALDANGHIFENVSKNNQLANGLDGSEQAPSAEHPEAHEVCAAAAATPAEKTSALGRICPPSEERALYYGLLGPGAQSVTYLEEEKPVTTPTGPEGAYLIVSPAAPGSHPNEPYGPGATALLPPDGPITEIHYRDGTVCHLTPTPEAACTPSGAPVGYVPAEPTPSATQTAATVSAQVVIGTHGQHEAIVSFNAPVAVNSVRDQYKIRWTHPGATPAENSVNATEADVKAGQALSAPSGPLPPGTTELQVVLQHATGPALLEGAGTVYVPVGSAAVNVP